MIQQEFEVGESITRKYVGVEKGNDHLQINFYKRYSTKIKDFSIFKKIFSSN
jgi:hypothetical protein